MVCNSDGRYFLVWIASLNHLRAISGVWLMEAPKCSLCGKRHYGLCEFGEVSRKPRGGDTAFGGTGRKSPEDIGRASEENACRTTATEGASKRKTANHRPRPAGENTAEPSTVVVDESEVGNGTLKMVQARAPLTPAEKQKAYRERLGDEYRRRNRERMRRKRHDT